MGIGPGNKSERTIKLEDIILKSDVVVGYSKYLEKIKDLTYGKKLVSSGMTMEQERCKIAITYAQQGRTVSLVSSGDSGIYGMAGLVIEITNKKNIEIPIEIVPGITASSSAAARLGAPLMLDFATISLSDLLVPWEIIEKRLYAVAAADMVVALYNPKSKKRIHQIEKAAKIFLNSRKPETPVGIVTDIGMEDERTVITDLVSFLNEEINMRSTIIIGNTSSVVLDGRFVTPRGYIQ